MLLARAIRSLSRGALFVLRVMITDTPSGISRPSRRCAISKVISAISLRDWGSITITLSASAGPRFSRSAWARNSVGAPPVTVRIRRIRPIIVPGPHIPSTLTPIDFWNSLIAPSVSGPKIPSTRPGLKPISTKRLCRVATSSPRIAGDSRRRERSPSFQRASSSAIFVASSIAPVIVKPRAC